MFFDVANRVRPIITTRQLLLTFRPYHPAIEQACEAIQSQISSGTSSDTTEINVHAWLSRASLEFIAQGGLGRSLDSLKDDNISPYAKAIRDLVFVII